MSDTSPLSVLVALQTAELDNGVSQVLLNLLPRLRAQGVVIHVVFPEEGVLELQLAAEGMITLIEPAAVFAGSHPLNIHQYASGLEARAGRLADYIRCHNIDLVNTHTFIHWDSALAARIATVPHLWSLHNLFGLGAECCLFKLMPWHQDQRMALLDLMGDAYVSVSKEAADSLRTAHCQRPLQVILNRLNNASFQRRSLEFDDSLELRSHLGLPDDAIIVGNIGRIHPVKDQLTLVEVAARVCHAQSKVHFVVVGPVNSQALYDSLCQRVEELGLQRRIHFVGSVANTAPLYQQFDVFLLTSVCEGLSLAVMEAMAAGCAIVATDSGGVRELIEDGVSGVVTPKQAVEVLVTEVERLLSDSGERIRLGNAARMRISYFDDWSVAAQEYAALYQSIVEGSVTVGGASLSLLWAQFAMIFSCADLAASNWTLEQQLSGYKRQVKRFEANPLFRLFF